MNLKKTALFALIVGSLTACDADDPQDQSGETEPTTTVDGSSTGDEGSTGEMVEHEACMFGYPEQSVTCTGLECADGPREIALTTVLLDEIESQGWSSYVDIIAVEEDAAIGPTSLEVTYHVHNDWFSASTFNENFEFQGDEPTAEEEAQWRADLVEELEAPADVVPMDVIEAAIAECDPTVVFDRCEHARFWGGMYVWVPHSDQCDLPRIEVNARTGELEQCVEPDPELCNGQTGGDSDSGDDSDGGSSGG